MCKIYADVEGKGKEGEVGAEGRTLVVGIPESLVAAVTALQFRPRYILGMVTIYLGRHDQEDAAAGLNHDASAISAPQSAEEPMKTY